MKGVLTQRRTRRHPRLLASSHGAIRGNDGNAETSVIELLLCLLLSQTLADFPEMSVGTEVRIYSNDLFTVFAAGTVDNGLLVLEGKLEAGKEVRVLILSQTPDENGEEEALAGAKALYGRISRDGKDILIRLEDVEGYLSLAAWLLEERAVIMQIGHEEAPEAGENQ